MPSSIWSTSFQAAAFATLIFAAVIYGACVQQVARYSYVFRNDNPTLKIWVYVLLSLTTAGFILDSMNTWGYLTTSAIASEQTVAVEGALSGLTIFSVQTFFVLRIWNVRREVRPDSLFTIPQVAVLALMALTSLVCVLTTTGFLTNPSRFPANGLTITANLLKVKISTDAVLDALVTVSLSALLQAHRSEFLHLRKDSPLEHLLVFFATRGIIMAVFQIVFLILVFATNYITVGTANTTLMPKVYAVSMLLTLNNRKTHRGRSDSGSTSTRPPRTHASDPVDLVVISFQGGAQRAHTDPEHGMPRSGRASPVVFSSSKGQPEEVTMEPEPDDFDKGLGDLRRTRNTKSSYPPS
ncbi:hypothetical protein PENSPDRAFT_650499 [Peniophora sp. CONT]|nr:hypothetical protein PENSPDRAFT_650499 [Peniophora sp. CONT]